MEQSSYRNAIFVKPVSLPIHISKCTTREYEIPKVWFGYDQTFAVVGFEVLPRVIKQKKKLNSVA
jgi:hypothetical protein